MPNRIIKESICYSADIDKLSAFEETVFYRILVRADDYGNLDARPEFLKSQLFTIRPSMSVARVARTCEKLCEAGLIERYEVDGNPYYHVVQWSKHQRLRTTRHKVPPFAATCGSLPQLAATCGNLRPESESESETETETEKETESELHKCAVNGFEF